jgi:maleate cis-trans isomerase
MKGWRARLGFPNAQAVFLSGTGMPTIKILQALEQDLGKPALSANSAIMWYALDARAPTRVGTAGFWNP